MGQKCWYLAEDARFWPNLAVFGSKIQFFGGREKNFLYPHNGSPMRHLFCVENIDRWGSNRPLGAKIWQPPTYTHINSKIQTNINIVKDDNWSRSKIPKKIKLIAHPLVLLQPPYSINGLRFVSKTAIILLCTSRLMSQVSSNFVSGEKWLTISKRNGFQDNSKWGTT